MVGYLVKRILALVLLVGAIMLMPVAGWFAAILFVILFAFSLIKHGFSDSTVSPAGSFFLLILGIFALSKGFGFIDKISHDFDIMAFIVTAFCALGLFAGGYIFRGFVYKDRVEYNMEEQVEKLTRFYPQLMMISAVLRVIIELARTFFTEALEGYLNYLDIGVKIGIALFVASILLYVFRMVHVFMKNR